MNKLSIKNIFNKKVVEMDKVSLERFIDKKVTEINYMHPVLIFDGGESLLIECSWRLRDEHSILVGSGEYNLKETHEKTYEKLLNLLIGKEIKEIIITSTISDLNIKFNNELFLEIFSNSNIYESWTLSDGKDLLLISLPGGGGCIFGE